jgi:hypothetical protein
MKDTSANAGRRLARRPGGPLSKVSILYLVGSGRSGSTLLSRILELQDGYRAVGETRYLGDSETWSLECGCGKIHQDCELWGPLIESWSEPGRLLAWGEANRAAQLDQLAGFAVPKKPRPGVERGLVEVRRIFENLAQAGDVVVDESKTPWLGYLAPGLRGCARPTTAWRMIRAVSWLTFLGHPAQGLEPVDGVGAFTNPAVNHIYLSNPDKRRRGPDSVRPTSRKAVPAPPTIGPWQRRAQRYWDTWLSGRTELNHGFG